MKKIILTFIILLVILVIAMFADSNVAQGPTIQPVQQPDQTSQYVDSTTTPSVPSSTPSPTPNPKPTPAPMPSKPKPLPVACTMEARICPDGSAVGRTGPNCEFSLCPGENLHESTTVSIGQSASISGIRLIPLKVLSDSRCPANVNCIWAGEIKVSVQLEKNNIAQQVEFSLEKNIQFEGVTLKLVNAKPEQLTGTTIKEGEYIFTFETVK